MQHEYVCDCLCFSLQTWEGKWKLLFAALLRMERHSRSHFSPISPLSDPLCHNCICFHIRTYGNTAMHLLAFLVLSHPHLLDSSNMMKVEFYVGLICSLTDMVVACWVLGSFTIGVYNCDTDQDVIPVVVTFPVVVTWATPIVFDLGLSPHSAGL